MSHVILATIRMRSPRNPITWLLSRPIFLALVLFVLLPTVIAVSPPPDGGYANANTAEGNSALFSLTTGPRNTALGFVALYRTTTGYYNTGTGAYALFSNTTGAWNAADGEGALYLNTTGNFNTAVGAQALLNNTTATFNTGIGLNALYHNTTGSSNTAEGANALLFNTTGTVNTAIGTAAGQNVIAGSNDTYIGNSVGIIAADESNTIRIGDLSNGNGAGSLACFIGGIFNNFQPVGGAVVEVTLDLSNDKLGWDVGTSPSNHEPFTAPPPRIAPGISTQRSAMLNGQVERLEATVAQQQKQIEILTAQLKEQATAIQKVNDRIKMTKTSSRIVAGN